MPFKKHNCKLGLGSDSMLLKEDGLLNRLCRGVRNFGQISQHHPETYERFYSYPALMAERHRHLYEGSRYLIHPFSLFSLTWTTIMIIVNLMHMCISVFRLCFIIVPIRDLKRQQIHVMDWIILVLDVFCWIDIVVKLNMGYVIGKMTDIVLDRSRITWRYLLRWFFIDLLSSIPVALPILAWWPHRSRLLLVALFLPLLRCARIYTVTVDIKVPLKMLTRSYIWTGCVQLVVVFMVTCHWCSCIIFLPPVSEIYWNGKVAPKYASFLNDGLVAKEILTYSVSTRYKKSVFVSLSIFFGTGYAMFIATEHDEILMHSFVIIYAAMFRIYHYVFMLKIYMTIFSSTIRYHGLTNQVEEYMRHKQFPLALKKRVRDFYYYRYQEKYFNEENVLNSLSEGLRNEVTLHTCSKLVEKVALFRDLPADVMGSILGCLQPEVYMPNEAVMRAGEIGHCMYFVDNGTVAVYSMKGVEVCHLEDGEYFGEVALLMKDNKRVSTVIAVEITLLYKLDHADFKQFIMANDLLYERVEMLASQRMHQTVILDEEYRLERTSSSGSALSLN